MYFRKFLKGVRGELLSRSSPRALSRFSRTNRNDPWLRFSSVIKGHFCSLLISNIICLSSWILCLPFAFHDRILKNLYKIYFGIWISLNALLGWFLNNGVSFCIFWFLNTVALTKGEWWLTLTFDDYTLAFIAWTISSDAPVCFMIPLCSDRLGLLKVFVLVYHWTVPPLLWL